MALLPMDNGNTVFASPFLQPCNPPPVPLDGLNWWKPADYRGWEKPALRRTVQEWEGEELRGLV